MDLWLVTLVAIVAMVAIGTVGAGSIFPAR